MQAVFGTDGIRGVAGQDLTARTAFALGNALVRIKKGARIVLGRDTRVSSDMLALALAAGAAAGGGIVLDGGVLPTAAVSFFVRREGADFGVVVSASHNPPEYNGLKVFGADGRKLADEEERRIERLLGNYAFAPSLRSGKSVPLRERGGYTEYLAACCGAPLAGKTFVLDCANGAAGAVAPRLFRRLGARVVALNCRTDGRHVNENCGALHPARMRRAVVAAGACAGFCYDGDADRLIAADEEGKLVDGDKLLCIFAREWKARGRLPHSLAVGTAHTNTGAERALAASGITLARTDVGDKYVAAYMQKSGAAVGGEQSGHLILADLAATGDGILASAVLAGLAVREKLSALADIALLPQYNVNVKVQDKTRVLGNEEVRAEIERAQAAAGVARLVVRASGTEPVIRIFAEAEHLRDARAAAEAVRAAIAAREG